jgi:co-chaperonin GroES (HSP10)
MIVTSDAKTSLGWPENSHVNLGSVVPLNDRVLVKPRELPTETKLGIIISTVKEKPNIGDVWAVSPPRDGDNGKSRLKVGDVIVYAHAMTAVKIQEVEYHVLKFHEVLAVMK